MTDAMSPLSPPPAPLPPPPPAQGSSALKWILIGCGCLMLVGIAGAAGCFFLASRAVHYAENMAKAWTELGDKHIRNNAVVEKHLGKVRTIAQVGGGRGGRGNPQTSMAFKVEGMNATGYVELEVEIKGVGDLMDPKVIASHLWHEKKKIDLQTGQEIRYEGAPPSFHGHDHSGDDHDHDDD